MLFNDTTKVYYNDNMALGHINNDPEFGMTHANAYFNINPVIPGVYPFSHKDSIVGIDSVVLSLSYVGSFGDSTTFNTIRVFEIAQNSDFTDTALFKYNHPDFLTTGAELGAKTFQISKLKDSVLHIRNKDTTFRTNVIRIPLSTSLGTRLASYDTTSTANGAYKNDSAFKKLFKGLAIKSDNTGNALVYTSPISASTSLIVYYRVKSGNGVIDTTQTEFIHTTNGQANIVTRTPGGTWNSYLTNAMANDDKLYIPTAPGSYGSLKIPALDTFKNAVIHRAELIITPLPTTSSTTFGYPGGFYLDRINNAGDTAFTFDADMSINYTGSSLSYDIGTFGGLLQSDSTYRFNLSRYVQNIITTKSRNFTLRLFAPIRAFVYSPGFNIRDQIYIADRVASGRIVFAGGSYINPEKRIRLRVVYSKL